MSIQSQQRVIEELQAKNRELRNEAAQARADARAARSVYEDLTTMCDEHVVAGLSSVPITLLRTIKPKGHGLP